MEPNSQDCPLACHLPLPDVRFHSRVHYSPERPPAVLLSSPVKKMALVRLLVIPLCCMTRCVPSAELKRYWAFSKRRTNDGSLSAVRPLRRWAPYDMADLYWKGFPRRRLEGRKAARRADPRNRVGG